jgi:DNA-binding GntR family transcriptional regulator
VEQHEALLAAVEKGDPARAERAMKDHLLYLRDVLRMVDEGQGSGWSCCHWTRP